MERRRDDKRKDRIRKWAMFVCVLLTLVCVVQWFSYAVNPGAGKIDNNRRKNFMLEVAL